MKKKTWLQRSSIWLLLASVAATVLVGIFADPHLFARTLLHATENMLRFFTESKPTLPIWIGHLEWHLILNGSVSAFSAMVWILHCPCKNTTAFCLAAPALCALYAAFAPLKAFASPDWSRALLSLSVSIGVAALIILLHQLYVKHPQILSRETVSYVFFGILTTVINILLAIVSYRILYKILLPIAANLLSNVIAWTGAVIFAFYVNRRFVFQSHTHGKQAWREGILFLGARLFSFVMDAIGMVVLVDLLSFPYGVSKIVMNIIVLILNYIFSKRIIFRSESQ